jgi:hypothetical protein
MQLIVLTLFVLLLVGVFSIYPGIVFAKHSSSEDNKKDSTSETQTNEPTKIDTTTTTTTEDNKQSDVIPVVPITAPISTIAASQTCSDGSDKTNDKICVSAANQEQTTSQPQSKPIPQSNPIVNTEISENPISTSTIQQNDNLNDNSEQNPSSGSTSGSSDNEQSSSQNNFSGNEDKNLGVESHFVVMQQDREIGLYRIVSDETDLDTHILPQTIRLVHSFDTAGEAMSWLSAYDNRSN